MITSPVDTMYNHFVRFFIFLPYLISCSRKKEYRYCELIKTEEESGEIDNMVQFKPFKAANDSAAYLKAFKMYCISVRIKNSRLYSNDNVHLTVMEFKLFSQPGQEITDVIFPDKELRKKEIYEEVSLMNIASLLEEKSESENALQRLFRMKKFLPPPKNESHL